MGESPRGRSWPEQVVIVTGATGGLGQVIAANFAALGARVISFARHAEGAGSVRVDVSSAAEVNAGFERVLAEHKRLDVLVNCAAINRDKSAHGMREESWREVIDVNLTGTFFCCQAALKPMREAGYGRIINVSSVVAQSGGIGIANYAASKGGVASLTRALASETGKYDITVNTVAPGYFEAGMIASVPQPMKDKLIEQIPKKRLGDPAELARLVVFLADPGSGYITGQEIHINGGLLM